jgi:hypothetical protein
MHWHRLLRKKTSCGTGREQYYHGRWHCQYRRGEMSCKQMHVTSLEHFAVLYHTSMGHVLTAHTHLSSSWVISCHIVSDQRALGASSLSGLSSSAYSRVCALTKRLFRKAHATPLSASSSICGPRPIAIPTRCQRMSSCDSWCAHFEHERSDK